MAKLRYSESDTNSVCLSSDAVRDADFIGDVHEASFIEDEVRHEAESLRVRRGSSLVQNLWIVYMKYAW